ncbi:tumor necrosis factor receptor superfamily member 4 isoform X1 [Ursus arctos]|uniref:tumor necrosis factor receptor superfamily member 4 isoform X1 n=1 Tax=Ursus arctos TaxID=9644 RepID=UPI000E6E03BD|nr:tumor necrosis factor receptor superfamily member 4 isoform X1 [Ursus arctos]
MGWRAAAVEARTPCVSRVRLVSTMRLQTMNPANPAHSAIRVSATPARIPGPPPESLSPRPGARRRSPQPQKQTPNHSGACCTTEAPQKPLPPPRGLRPRGVGQEHVPASGPLGAVRAGCHRHRHRHRHRGSCCGPGPRWEGRLEPPRGCVPGATWPEGIWHPGTGENQELPGCEGAAGLGALGLRPPACPAALAALAFPPTVPASPDPPGSGSEAKRRCTATQDTVCSCKPGTEPQDGFKRGVDCAPCPPGQFSPGDDRACKPWTNCTLMGKRTVRPASQSSDAVCEDRSPPATLPWETQGPPAWPPTTQPTTAWTRASQGPFTPPTEPPRGPQLAAVLGLGLGLLAPVAAALALLLHHRAWRLPPSGNSFRTPIQEEHADANSTLAKI